MRKTLAKSVFTPLKFTRVTVVDLGTIVSVVVARGAGHHQDELARVRGVREQVGARRELELVGADVHAHAGMAVEAAAALVGR